MCCLANRSGPLASARTDRKSFAGLVSAFVTFMKWRGRVSHRDRVTNSLARLVKAPSTNRMSIALGLALIAQSAVPLAAEAARPRAQATVSVAVGARVIRPVIIRADGTLERGDDQTAATPQQHRDEAGTVWIEFS